MVGVFGAMSAAMVSYWAAYRDVWVPNRGLTPGSFIISSILLVIGGGAGLVLGMKAGSAPLRFFQSGSIPTTSGTCGFAVSLQLLVILVQPRLVLALPLLAILTVSCERCSCRIDLKPSASRCS